MKKFLFLSAIIAFSLYFAACNKDDNDNTPPTIVIEEPEANDSLRPGSNLHFGAEFTDNVMLKKYKVDIHSAEGHTHATKATASDSVWLFQKTYDISGQKNATVHEMIPIPSNAKEGKYHLVAYCTDEAGNESLAYVTFTVSSKANDHEHE